MDSAQYGTVPQFFTHTSNIRIKSRLIHFAQHRLIEIGRHCFHLLADGRIFIGKRRMAPFCICNAQTIIVFCQIKIHFFHYGAGRITKINGDHAAHAAGCLIHQAAGFAKIFIFRILTDLCDVYRGETALVVFPIEYSTNDNLERSRTGQP